MSLGSMISFVQVCQAFAHQRTSARGAPTLYCGASGACLARVLEVVVIRVPAPAVGKSPPTADRPHDTRTLHIRARGREDCLLPYTSRSCVGGVSPVRVICHTRTLPAPDSDNADEEVTTSVSAAPVVAV